MTLPTPSAKPTPTASVTLLGAILVPLSFVNPWVALIGYGIYVGGSARPIESFNKMRPLLTK